MTGLSVSGASTANLRGFQTGESVRLDASGSSKITGAMQTGDLSAAASGSSYLQLAGSGGDLNVTASGASEVELAEFTVRNATIRASGVA